jgi:hypothetical protein
MLKNSMNVTLANFTASFNMETGVVDIGFSGPPNGSPSQFADRIFWHSAGSNQSIEAPILSKLKENAPTTDLLGALSA